MHPKTMRLQNTQQNCKHQATSVRKHPGRQRVQTRTFMTTEYQERFLPPHCYTAVVSSCTQKDPYHPLKGTSADVTTFRSFYVTHKWNKQPPKAPQPSLPLKGQRRGSSAPHNPTRSVANQMTPKVEDYTSVYKNDFQAWKASKRQPYKLADSLKVNQGLVVPKTDSKEGHSLKNSAQFAANSKPVPQVQQPQPFESVTSYRSDYVAHPVQPRKRREKPVYQSKGLPLEPVASLKPKEALDTKKELFDEANELFEKFQTWSLETQFHGRGKEPSAPADHDCLSTTHADYTALKCQGTKPILPSTQTREESKELLQTSATMNEDFRAWDTPKHCSCVHKEEPDWPKKTTFSQHTPPESCKTNPEPLSLQPKGNEPAVCNSSCQATKEPQRPDAFSPGTEQSGTYWKSFRDRGVTWADGEMCEEPPQAHQIISCMVSSRS